MGNRRGGIITLRIDGEVYDAIGSFDYNLGRNKREALNGSDRTHGYKEMPQEPFIEGEVRDRGDFNLAALVEADEVSATLDVANGKLFILRRGWFAAEGTVSTEEGSIGFRIEGLDAEEVPAP